MLKLRTKLLLLAIAGFGIGIGVLAGIDDGAYSAICLFVLPVLVALAAASIVSDFNSPNAVKPNSATWERPRFTETPAALDIPTTAWTKTVLHEVSQEWTN